MLLIFLHYQHSFPQLAFPENPRQQATFTPHPAKGTPECTEVSKYQFLPVKEISMKAIRIYKFGPTEEVLQYEDVPTPKPGPEEMLVKVGAASLNRADLGLRSGNYRIAPEDLPIIPGREFAGTIVSVGSAVQEYRVNQRVVDSARARRLR